MTNVGYHIRNGWLQKPPLGVQLNRAHPLTKGLVGCWMFNEGGGDKAYDLSGYNNHGTLENMAFPATTTSGWNPCKDGSGLMFDGNNDCIDCGNGPSLNITDAITIEVSGKTSDISRNYQGLVGKGISDKGYHMMFDSTNGKVGLWLDLSVSGWCVGNLVTVTNNTHYRIAGTYDGSAIIMYLNGIGGTPVLKTGAIQNADTRNLQIGKDEWGVFYFKGSGGSVKIYNRALSDSEIQQLYMYPYAMFEPATKYTIIDERLATDYVGGNVMAAELI